MSKINLAGEEIELKMTMQAVETIEDNYNKSLDEIFSEDTKFKAKDVAFILWAMAGGEGLQPLVGFKKLLSDTYSYNKCIEFLTKAFEDGAEKNEKAAEGTDASS